MNTVVILLDSLNRHCLEAYGETVVCTPNLRRFGERAVVFDNHYAGSLPCMPARRELFTGRCEFLWRGWGHVEPWDGHLARDAKAQGCTTQMITDHYHYWEHGAHGYFEPFDGVDFVRGHELDMSCTAPVAETELPDWAAAINRYRTGRSRNFQGQGTSYFANVRDWTDESAFSCAQTMSNAASWLDGNHAHESFFLWLEGVDPHEPHFVPEPYRSMYTSGRMPERFNCWPPYQNLADCQRFLNEANDEEIAWIRAQYFGKLTMVDQWLGRFFDAMDRHGLWDSTAVIVTTDHGHDLCYDRQRFPHPWGKQYPHPETHAHTPLMVWHPQYPGKGRRVNALTWAVDVHATAQELLGGAAKGSPHGRSLMPLLRGETAQHRDWVLTGTFGTGATLTTPEWTLAQGSTGTETAYWYSTTPTRVTPDMTSGKFIPGVDIPQWRVPAGKPCCPSYLWRREPFTLTPESVLERFPDVAASMRDRLRAAIAEVGAPPETLARLGLV
ncbi:MAG: hypothetical protein A3K18_00585 [Lentisphaerae bacterium RIFOXYA12_64_32]|nr:MAG: hypothetical protein A3K18_00585 [Lentisphaerae bacterium RIFOXYA12_64_32]